MTCSACGHDNRAGRKFCVECGATLVLACATYGEDIPEIREWRWTPSA